MQRQSSLSGFSLLELALTVGIAGTVMTGLWQMMGATGQSRDAAVVASQALALASAGQQYINTQRATLLALPALSTTGSVARIKIMAADAGDTANSLVSAGFLPQAIITNTNNYGQTYRLYVLREDGGAIGADDSDKLIGLLITSDGTAISDSMGARISSLLGNSGGFFYAADNAADPAILARGTANGWQISTSAPPWSTLNSSGTVTTAGRLALLTNLTPSNSSGSSESSGGSGGNSINDLSDGTTDYGSRSLMYIGDRAGELDVSTGGFNTALGIEAMRYGRPSTINAHNAALGYFALRYSDTNPSTTASTNVAVGAFASQERSNGGLNVAVGYSASRPGEAVKSITAVGARAGYNCSATQNAMVAIGTNAGAATLGGICTDSVYLGAHTGSQQVAIRNTFIGANIGKTSGNTGEANTAVGYNAFDNITDTATNNVAFGYRAANNLTSGSNNIAIGNNTTVDLPTGDNQINIGNLVYGNSTDKWLNIGSPARVTGISFDVGSQTSAARLASGTTAQRPACTLSLQGSQRWNTTDQALEYCNGVTPVWLPVSLIPAGNSPQVPPTRQGYIVLSKSTWDGALGGRLGVRQKCLAELTTYNWMGKATAVANGQLVMGKVEAMIWGSGASCSTRWFHPVPSARYNFAVADQPAKGGAYITANSTGEWFPDANNWSGGNYFDGFYAYWANGINCDTVNYACNGWANNSPSYYGGVGYTSSNAPQIGQAANQLDQRMGSGQAPACDTQQRLVCLVHP